MAGTFQALPATLQPAIQTGALDRQMEEGFDSILAYRKAAIQELIPSKIGETLTKSRKGRLAPVPTALVPSSMTGLDNGLTPANFSVEQYTFTLAPYGATADVNWIQAQTTIFDLALATARNNGVQAAQTLERIAVARLFGAYLGGQTRVRKDLATPTTTTVKVDDLRGFQFVSNNGVLQPVSVTFPITAQEINSATGAVVQTLNITAQVPDGSNVSTAPGGISGQLTFTVNAAPTTGNAIVSSQSPKILRAGGALATGGASSGTGVATPTGLQSNGLLTTQLIADGVTYLRNNAVPTWDNGTYLCILDPTSLRQLYADQDFKLWFAGQNQADAFSVGLVNQVLGVTFQVTTEAPQQVPTNITANAATDAVNVNVKRPIIMGAECLIQGNFEGIWQYLVSDSVSYPGYIEIVNNVAQIVRPPLDRLQQTVSMSWFWGGDFAVPTDITATTAVIPTASASLYKRCVVIEHSA